MFVNGGTAKGDDIIKHWRHELCTLHTKNMWINQNRSETWVIQHLH
jgi:hypothetical protein